MVGVVSGEEGEVQAAYWRIMKVGVKVLEASQGKEARRKDVIAVLGAW